MTVVSDLMPQTASDARQGPRANVSWAARIAMGPQAYLEARVVNVSEEGLCLVCEQAFADGAVLNVLIALPDPADRSRYTYPSLQTRVVFHVLKGTKVRVGTRILSTDPATKSALAQWVKKG